jgi:SAM-dependent methyltransferase
VALDRPRGGVLSESGAQGTTRAGAAVIAAPGGIPDLLRVEDVKGEVLRLAADADPGSAIEIERRDLLAVATLDRRPYSAAAAGRRRRRLDIQEAWAGSPDRAPEPGSTVREKYEVQAPFYAANVQGGLAHELLRRISERLPAGSRVLVLGSGAGFECVDLAANGYRVTGLDFAPSMIEQSRALARQRSLDVDFRLGDLRDPTLTLDACDGVLFTYDVYSFIPERSVRVRVLLRLAETLTPDGAIFLSARIARSSYERFVLTLQHARQRGGEWGDTHTRWVDGAGTLHRSFVHLFTPRALEAELRAAGLRLAAWDGGHGLVLPATVRARSAHPREGGEG